jgi:septum formation protein
MLVLASASPRRADLLAQAGLTFEVRATGVDERPLANEAAVEHARRIAAAKVEAAASALRTTASAVILAADTVVWQPPDGPPLGKPDDRSHATAMLRALTRSEAGPHCVTTAWAIARAHASTEVHDETTRVWMRPVDADELEAYLDCNEWCDKAGGYGIQGRAGAFVSRIEGSYTNVVGLPLAQVVSRLRALKRGGATP